MNERVAKTKTVETAWALVERLRLACPHNDFALLIRRPGDGPEIIPLLAFHPLDVKAAKAEVKKYAAELALKQGGPHRFPK